jgi:hypothetical protein
MKDTKKEWVKPELVILVRNKPEETVLAPCKEGEFGGGGGPYNHQFFCIGEPCGICFVVGSS